MDFKKNLKEALTIKFDKAFGLDISDRSVEIAELEKVFRFTVTTYGRADLPVNVVNEGRIIDPDTLALKIKNLLREVKPKKVSTNKVILSLPEAQTFFQSFIIGANIKGSELNKQVMEKITLNSPIHPDKMYWDISYELLPDKKNKVVMFVGVPKEVATSYVKLCNSIGLEVVALSTEAFSLSRVILKKSDKQSLIIDIGSDVTNLVYFDGADKIQMAVSVPIAGELFTQIILAKLGLDRDAAESLKIKEGFLKNGQVKEIIMPLLEDLAQEIKVSIEYYESNFNQKLDEIHLTGGSALLPEIVNNLKELVGRDIKIVSSGNNISLSFLSDKSKNFPLFTNVLGLGMLGASAQFKDFNLLKKMPHSEINDVDRLNLFKMGYLSRVNTIRMIFNNKYVLVTLILLIGVIFAVLIQQAETFGLASASIPIVENQ